MLCFLSSCSWWRRFYSGCSRSSSTWIQVYWNSSRIMGSNLDGIVWRCDSHRMHFCTNPRSWSCRSIQERISLYIRILCCFMRPISLMKIHENIHTLNSLANMSFELCFFRGGWSQIIILTTLRILVPYICFKHSYKVVIEECMYYTMLLLPLYLVNIKNCHPARGRFVFPMA